VHLLYYIFAQDRTGIRVADALRSAAARGVACRVLVDDAGSRGRFAKIEASMRDGGVDVRRLLPVSILRVPFKRIDIRNHRKLAVIDGRVSFVGSQNIVDAHLSKRLGAYEDLTVRLVGPAVMGLQMTFLDDWLAETGEQLQGKEFYPPSKAGAGVAVQIVRSGPPFPNDAFSHLIVAAISESHERVTITTPYFVPDEPTMAALRIAALRGVLLQVVVPRKSDAGLVDAACRAYFASLLEVGVRVYRHGPGVLHSKVLTVDDSFALVGSSNLDQRSFGLNYELNVLLFGPKVTEQLIEHQERYLAKSARVVEEAWRRRPRHERLLDNVASLFSPLL
jgi:cardiolipin synthase